MALQIYKMPSQAYTKTLQRSPWPENAVSAGSRYEKSEKICDST